jgi:hypothetical protein
MLLYIRMVTNNMLFKGRRQLQHYRIAQWAGRRFWESRQFYSAYIALFVAITNWITIQYKLLLENIPVLNAVFSNIWIFMIAAAVIFTIISVLGGHYIHRKRQFRLENALSVEENPYLYKAIPGKEKDLMIPVIMLQLDALEEILQSNNALSNEKKKQFETYRQGLIKLTEGHSIGQTWKH